MTSSVAQRFQVKISGQWNDYNAKEDEVLKAAFDNFILKMNEKTISPQESFKELVIKGRRYIVDFHKMVQVRKDNKKDYKVRPPEGSPDGGHDGLREQGQLNLKCARCDQQYTLRTCTSRPDGGDWADCQKCQQCWQPFLDKEKVVEDRKVEKNHKQRQVQQPCRLSTSSVEKVPTCLKQTHVDEQRKVNSEPCAYCGEPFQEDQPVFLGACDKHCALCHEECGKNQSPDAIELATLYSTEYPKFFMRSKDLNPGCDLKRTIQEEYQRHDVHKEHSIRPSEITAF